MIEKFSGAAIVKDIGTELLEPNDYNPNRMTEEEFKELVAEVTRLSRLPKPVVVRPNGNAGYLIVDGEHGWRAATKAGLKTVACEIIEADDFEAMRQTYKRNQHGTHAPILLGQFFQRMMKERNLSQRALAKEIDISEGSVRNAIQYAIATGVRNDYAWEELTVRQVRLYNHLPRAIGDLWLDTGAKVSELLGQNEAERNWTVRQLEKAERKDDKKEGLHFPKWEELAQTGLIEVVRQRDGWEYQGFKKLVKLIEEWSRYERRWAYNGVMRGRLRPYAQHYFLGAWSVRDADKMDGALEYLIDTSTTPASFRLSPAEFEPLVKEAESADALEDLLKAAILNKGITLPHWRELSSAQQKLMEAEINQLAPDYIKQSALGTKSKYWLWKAEGCEDIKREIASSGITESVLGKYDDDDRVKWCVRREIEARTTAVELEAAWKKMSSAELVGKIASRWALYDISDKEPIERLSKVLIQLTKAELMFLYRWSEGIEREQEEWDRTRARWAAEEEAMAARWAAEKETP